MSTSIRSRILKAIEKSEFVDKNRYQNFLNKSKGGKEEDILRSLVEEDVISAQNLLTVLSEELGLPAIDVSKIELDDSAMRTIPERLVRKYKIIPLSRIGNSLTLVVSDPTDVMAIDDVRTITGCEISLVIADQADLEKKLLSYYEGEEDDITDIIDEEAESDDIEVLGRSENLDVADITKKSKQAPIVKMVNLIISEALKNRASDIHVEPQEKSVRIRNRIDGALQEAFDLPKKNQNAVIARLKIMSNLDITENRVPQDGRFRINMDGRDIDFRVSILPCRFGNKIVLRALDKSGLSFGLETLGFLPDTMNDFKQALSKPFGIILVTGPTGSGKSTTLYSVLNEMNVPERNIVTIEDPVEYQVQGITQIPARPDIGLNFASGLRSVLRQSPDVIMVGEIRDYETADIAIKASLTGHMVLSTLHTNDAVGAITRLVNMGVEPFLIASSLVMACAQRLLRKICPHCKVKADLPKEVLSGLREKYPDIMEQTDTFYKGKGCQKCNDTGYLGRFATLETVLVDEKINGMINRKKSEEEIKKYLRSKGVRTLRENALIKFCKGWTTYEEVLRVT